MKWVPRRKKKMHLSKTSQPRNICVSLMQREITKNRIISYFGFYFSRISNTKLFRISVLESYSQVLQHVSSSKDVSEKNLEKASLRHLKSILKHFGKMNWGLDVLESKLFIHEFPLQIKWKSYLDIHIPYIRS